MYSQCVLCTPLLLWRSCVASHALGRITSLSCFRIEREASQSMKHLVLCIELRHKRAKGVPYCNREFGAVCLCERHKVPSVANLTRYNLSSWAHFLEQGFAFMRTKSEKKVFSFFLYPISLAFLCLLLALLHICCCFGDTRGQVPADITCLRCYLPCPLTFGIAYHSAFFLPKLSCHSTYVPHIALLSLKADSEVRSTQTTNRGEQHVCTALGHIREYLEMRLPVFRKGVFRSFGCLSHANQYNRGSSSEYWFAYVAVWSS